MGRRQRPTASQPRPRNAIPAATGRQKLFLTICGVVLAGWVVFLVVMAVWF